MAYDTTISKTTSNTLEHLQSYKLRRTALEALWPNFTFYQVCEHDQLGMREGKTLRWHRYTHLGANTTAVAEGIVGTGIAHPPVKILDATISQYSDYLTISDLLRDTAPDAILDAFARELGFRAGLTGDNIMRAIIDAETSAAVTLQGQFLSAKDSRGVAYILQGRNVFAQTSGWFEQLSHPYNVFDIVNDPTSAGFLDIYKYTDPSKAAVNQITDRGGEVGTVSGVRIRKSTNVKKTSGTPNQWRSYIFGREAVGTVSLSSQPFNQISDPSKDVFKVTSQVYDAPSVANPMGLLGGSVSYKFTLVGKILSGTAQLGGSYKHAYIDAPSGIVA